MLVAYAFSKIENVLFLRDIGTYALCGIYPKKLAKKAQMNLKKFKKLSMQFDRQNSALYSELSQL